MSMHRLPVLPATARRLMALAPALLLACAPAAAQFKVVGPDGRVTYTDRPPADAGNARITPMNRPSGRAPQPSDLALPFELRGVAQRHPVTLFTSAECTPCEGARRFLRGRGVPYAEKRVATQDDADALERLVGGRTVPSLTIGGQALRGFGETDWTAYLDAAGYPRESRLPRTWTPPEPTPLVERSAPAPAQTARGAAPAPAPTPPEPGSAEPTPSGGTTIRF